MMTPRLVLKFLLFVSMALPIAQAGSYEPLAYEKLTGFNERILAVASDVNDLASSLSGVDREVAIGFETGAENIMTMISRVEDFVLIQMVINDEADKNRVTLISNKRIKTAADDIDRIIKGVNHGLGHTKNAALVSEAGKLKDEMRRLQQYLFQLCK